jgi:alpha-L-rhamnosidase
MNKHIKLYIFLLSVICGDAFSQQPDFRGPIHSDQFEVNRTKDGIFATKLNYRPSVDTTIKAKWIWINSVNYPDQQTAKAHWTGKRKDGALYVIKFKKLLNIKEDVDFADLKISADIQYRMFINGKLIQRGPANIGSDYDDHVSPRHWFYDDFTSKDAFKKGINVIAVEVSTLSKTASSTTSGHGGLIVAANVHLKSGKNIVLKTDTSWICEPSKAYLPNFEVDASAESADWMTRTKNDGIWDHAVVLPDSITAKWKLKQSELPQMMETRIYPVKISKIVSVNDTVASSFPIQIKKSDTLQRFRLEFDNLYTGYLGLKIDGKAGAKLKIMTREVSSGKTAQELNYIMADGLQTFEFPNLIDGKYVDLEIMSPSGDLKINDIVINYSAFPVTYTGSFSCSDSSLNTIWKNIRWITQMNMQTYHMDSPVHQEPVSDAGDYLIESMVNYYAFSSPLLIKQDLRKIALVFAKTDYKMFHTSYMLLWEQMLLNYYEYTGDKVLLKELSPVVYKLISQFRSYKGNKGIITEAPNYMFMDWGSINNIGLHHPPASWGQGYMTAFYYKAVTDATKMAGYLQDQKQYDKLTAEAQKLKLDFNNVLYDSSTGLYKNGLYGEAKMLPGKWLPKDTVLEQILPYTNALAVAYGLAPVDKEHNIVNYVITQKNVTVSPYFMYFVFEALTSSNSFNEYGISQLRRWNKLSGYPVGLKEGWTMGDYSHAWGGSAAYELSAAVLGIKPAKPGFAEIVIQPNPGDLKWANGTVHTVKGNINISWTNTLNDFELQSNTPAKVPVTFILPLYKRNAIIINGKKLIVNHINYQFENIRILKIDNNTIRIQTPGGRDNIRILKN